MAIMRRALDGLYLLSGALGAAFIAGICLVVLLQVGANLLDTVVAAFGGRAPGLLVPSYAEFAGFFLAAASFLALPYTLRTGGHIRVTLIIQRLSGRPRRAVELWCTGLAAVLAVYFAFFTVMLVWDSFRFGDLSPGLVPVPLWLPQSAVALGLVILAIALIDEFCAVARGANPSYEGQEDALLAERAGGQPARGEPD